MKPEEYYEYLTRWQVPPHPVDMTGMGLGRSNSRLSYLDWRHLFSGLNMWALVDLESFKPIAEWIGKRRVLEVMAGAGWMAQALAHHGIEVTATDDYSWHNKGFYVEPPYTAARLDDPDCEIHTGRVGKAYDILHLSCSSAIRTWGDSHDVLLMSWPPYGSPLAHLSGEIWGSEKPIIFIGESRGGCTADDKFYIHFHVEETFGIPQWRGMYDYVQIGYYRADQPKESYPENNDEEEYAYTNN